MLPDTTVRVINAGPIRNCQRLFVDALNVGHIVRFLHLVLDVMHRAVLELKGAAFET